MSEVMILDSGRSGLGATKMLNMREPTHAGSHLLILLSA